jgi:hypothetical protein
MNQKTLLVLKIAHCVSGEKVCRAIKVFRKAKATRNNKHTEPGLARKVD